MSTQPHGQYDPYEEVLVSPLYLAGSNGSGEAGFAPVAHWPHHHLDEGPCQLLVTSPDQRIRIGWFGDDFDLWKISAAEEAVAAPRWTATFNHVTPAEIVAGLTTALAQDYAASDPDEGNGRFLANPSMYWADAAQPLTDAGWTRSGAAERGTVEIIAPDGQAGILIDRRRSGWDDEVFTLWAGPPGWETRAEATFTAHTPSHLIAATAAAMTDPTPVLRERHHLDHRMTDLATLTPVRPADTQAPSAPRGSRAPTPLDVRRTAVTQAVHRAARLPRTAADLRVMAAHSLTDLPGRHRPNPAPVLGTGPQTSSSNPRRSR
ncbi:SPDY domain-containing protein [Streptomyces sp. S6]